MASDNILMVLLYFLLLGLHRLVCRSMIEMAWSHRHLWLGWRQTTRALFSPYYGFHVMPLKPTASAVGERNLPF